MNWESFFQWVIVIVFALPWVYWRYRCLKAEKRLRQWEFYDREGLRPIASPILRTPMTNEEIERLQKEWKEAYKGGTKLITMPVQQFTYTEPPIKGKFFCGDQKDSVTTKEIQ